MLLKHKFTPYFRATEIKVKCRSCNSGHRRYCSMNIDGKHQQKRLFLHLKLILIKSMVQWLPSVSIFNDSPLQIKEFLMVFHGHWNDQGLTTP